MKKINHNTRSAVWLLVLLAVATLSSCQKDEPLPPGGNIPAAKSSTRSIPHYNDERTFLRTLNTILAFDSLPQRLAFEAATQTSNRYPAPFGSKGSVGTPSIPTSLHSTSLRTTSVSSTAYNRSTLPTVLRATKWNQPAEPV